MRKQLIGAAMVVASLAGCERKTSQFQTVDLQQSNERSKSLTIDLAKSGSGTETVPKPTGEAAEFLAQKQANETAAQRTKTEPPTVETVSLDEARALTRATKDALVALGAKVGSASGNCKTMAEAISSFASDSRGVFEKMRALEPKLTKAQRDTLESEFRDEISSFSAQLSKSIGDCTKDPEFIKAMTKALEQGNLGGPGPAAANSANPTPPAPTMDPATADSRFTTLMVTWSAATESLASEIEQSKGDCGKVGAAVKSFNGKTPDLVAELRSVLPSTTKATRDAIQAQYEPLMSKAEQTISPALKACENDPVVGAEIRKLPKARK